MAVASRCHQDRRPKVLTPPLQGVPRDPELAFLHDTETSKEGMWGSLQNRGYPTHQKKKKKTVFMINGVFMFFCLVAKPIDILNATAAAAEPVLLLLLAFPFTFCSGP